MATRGRGWLGENREEDSGWSVETGSALAFPARFDLVFPLHLNTGPTGPAIGLIVNAQSFPMYKRSDWKQGADLPKIDQPLAQGDRVILRTRKIKDSPAIKSRTKIKIRWGTDGSAQRISVNMGNLSRVFPVRIPGYKGFFTVADTGIEFQYRDKRSSFPVAVWHRGTLRRSSQCPVELFNALQQSNIYLFDGSEVVSITWRSDCEMQDRQAADPDAKIIPVKKTAPYKAAIGVAAHKQNMEDWRREARPAACLIKYDIRNGSRPLPAQRIARREAIAVIDQKEIDTIRARRRAATLKKR